MFLQKRVTYFDQLQPTVYMEMRNSPYHKIQFFLFNFYLSIIIGKKVIIEVLQS